MHHRYPRRIVAIVLTAGLSVAVPAFAAGANGGRAASAPVPPPEPAVVLADAGTHALTLAAGEGHVLAIQATPPTGSRLMELAPGQEPRLIRTLPGGVPLFSVGTDAAGRAVAIADLCKPDTGKPRARDCDLSVIDVERGTTVRLPGSTTAYLGDLDHGRALLARFSKRVGSRAALRPAASGGRTRSLPISRVAQRAPGADGTYARTRYITALDLQDGVSAATVTIENDMSGYDALLLARGPKSKEWNLLDHLQNGDGGDGNHFFGGPVVTPTGIRAFADWGFEEESYTGRWSVSGKLLKKVFPSAVGLDGFNESAVISGDTLVVAPVIGFSDADEPHPARAAGPLGLG